GDGGSMQRHAAPDSTGAALACSGSISRVTSLGTYFPDGDLPEGPCFPSARALARAARRSARALARASHFAGSADSAHIAFDMHAWRSAPCVPWQAARALAAASRNLA